MKNKIIYLDNASTTPVYQEVLDEMIPYFNVHFGNASSHSHPIGWMAKEAVERSRKMVAEFIGAKPTEIFFTSGATEAINQAHKSYFELTKGSGCQIITQPSEHSAVRESCYFISENGGEVNYLSVAETGKIEIDELRKKLSEGKTIHYEGPPALVSIMSANNETGILQPVHEIGELKKELGFLFFCDATQSIGKQKINVRELNCDFLVFSAHKIGGPKGCGVLFISESIHTIGLNPLIHGGLQEAGLRAGTQNVPAIVGLGKAIECSSKFQTTKISDLKNKLETALEKEFDAKIIGKDVERICHISSVRFPEIIADDLIMKVNHQLAISTGAACNSSKLLPSHVLQAMGFSHDEAYSTLRFSLGYQTTEEEINEVIDILKVVI